MKHEQLPEVLNRTMFATNGKQLYAGTSILAAEILVKVLDHHGLEIVGNTGLVYGGSFDRPDKMKVVKISDQGIYVPRFKKPVDAKLAHRLGVALIGGANCWNHWREADG